MRVKLGFIVSLVVISLAVGRPTRAATAAVARTAVGWGWNLSGQTTVPSQAVNLTAIAAGGQHALGLKSNGTVVAWGAAAAVNALPAGLFGVTAISAGSEHSVALKSDTSLVMWSDSPANGQRTNFPANNSGFTAISARFFHTLAVRTDGTVVSWGADPAYGLEAPPATLSGVRAVAAGIGYDLALRHDGSVVAWASPRLLASADYKGQATVPAGLANVTAIAAGQFHALALRADGTVVGWGGASRNGPAHSFTVPTQAASGVVAIACGLEHSLVLKADGTIVAWGQNTFGQSDVPAAATGVRQLAAGDYFNLALVGDGVVEPPLEGPDSPPPPIAPFNLAGYRSRLGQVFQFVVTGSNTGPVWGTDVYTDNSHLATAAVHAGLLAVGETKTVTLFLGAAPGPFAGSTRQGITSNSAGSWPAGFVFADGGARSSPATTLPALRPDLVPAVVTVPIGSRLVLPVFVTGGGPYTYQWSLNNAAIPGATANPYVVETTGTAQAGTYTVAVTNSLGTSRLAAATVSVVAAGTPVVSRHPSSQTVLPGAGFRLSAAASGTELRYEWRRNGTVLPGETAGTLERLSATAADAGDYDVRISNSAGSVLSRAATVSVVAGASRPANFSVRTALAPGQTVIAGFYLQGNGSKRVLIRAVGPGLVPFGVPGALTDPRFEIFQGAARVGQNDNWSAPNIGEAFTATGAFGLAPGSRDAALVTDLAAGNGYTVHVTNPTSTRGIVLIEIYDADALTGRSSSKLTNTSVRGQTGPGDDVLTLGFVLGGSGPRSLLIRGIGPQLAAYGVTGALPDPRLQLLDPEQRPVLANHDWVEADFVSELTLASRSIGAFNLDPGSKDAALLAVLEPGAYTVQLAGVPIALTGEALVEVYELP